MGNKGELVWVLFLLHMDYALLEDTCERRTCLGQFTVGHFLPRSIFATKYEVSPFQCAIECRLRRPRCKSFNYRRSDLTCQLSEEDSGPDGIYLQPKPGKDHSNIDTWRNLPIGHCKEINCSWNERCDPSKSDPQNACVKSECPFAVLKPGVTFQPTNETKVGIKGRYRCVSGNLARGDSLTMCLASTAQWSPTDFKCVCKTTVKPGAIYETAELEVGQIYTYRCQNGLIGKRNQNPTVTCLQDGNWTPTNFACVCKTPPAKSGTITETAEVEIGQNYTYRCQDGLVGKRDLNPTVMCLPGGDWTTTNFTCVCTIPAKSGAINSTAEVEIGQNYTYRCEINLFKKGDENPTVTCLRDGRWTSTNFICEACPFNTSALDMNSSCTLSSSSVSKNWTLGTVYPNNIHKSEVISNRTGIHLLTCMRECDNEPTKCLSFFYDNQTGLCVLSSSFQRGLPNNGFQFSVGMVYYTAPSSSCDLQYRNVTLAGSYFCIKYHTEARSFNEAMKACEPEKAKLLVVTTTDQITDLANIWRNLDAVVYIGLSDQIEEGHWVSWNGKIVHPSWGPGQPNIVYNEHCAGIWMQNEIHDIDCDLLITFLCHKIHFVPSPS